MKMNSGSVCICCQNTSRSELFRSSLSRGSKRFSLVRSPLFSQAWDSLKSSTITGNRQRLYKFTFQDTSAYWMLRSLKKAEKWTTLLEVDERYGMDTLKWISKLLPMQAREPESFNRQHPAYSRGQFAIEYNLDLQTLRKEANDRMRATKCDVTRRPQLGMLCNPFLCNADFKAETVIDSQSQDDQISPISSPRHGKQNDQVPVPDINRPRKRIRTSLKTIDSTVVDHTIEEESL